MVFDWGIHFCLSRRQTFAPDTERSKLHLSYLCRLCSIFRLLNLFYERIFLSWTTTPAFQLVHHLPLIVLHQQLVIRLSLFPPLFFFVPFHTPKSKREVVTQSFFQENIWYLKKIKYQVSFLSFFLSFVNSFFLSFF